MRILILLTMAQLNPKISPTLTVPEVTWILTVLNFMFLQTRILSINHNVLIQITNMSDLVPQYYIPKYLNNQVETNTNPISSHLTPLTLYPNIIFKPLATQQLLTQRLRQKIQLNQITTPVILLMHLLMNYLREKRQKGHCHIKI